MTGASARSRPTGRGLPSGGISQSSGTRVASAAEGGRDDGDGAALHIDGRHEMALAAAFDRCDERLLFA